MRASRGGRGAGAEEEVSTTVGRQADHNAAHAGPIRTLIMGKDDLLQTQGQRELAPRARCRGMRDPTIIAVPDSPESCFLEAYLVGVEDLGKV
jgi:hypothetical protein